MATTTSSFTPYARPHPWKGITDPAREFSAAPRGELRFSVDGGTVTAAAAGNDQRIAVTCNLPIGFAYTFAECFMRTNLAAADQGDWDTIAQIAYMNGSNTNDPDYVEIFFPQKMVSGTVSGTLNLFDPPEMPKITLQPIGNEAASVQWNLYNLVIDGGAGALDFFARFYIYDYEQGNAYEMNSPALIR